MSKINVGEMSSSDLVNLLSDVKSELHGRNESILNDKIKKVYDAVQELENFAGSSKQVFELYFGDNVKLVYDLDKEDYMIYD